ncbi:MAG: hypothetical protein ACYCU5_00180, partial [Actinomycetes bacterium]
MTVRHMTSLDNVDIQGFLIDASTSCHGTIRGGRVEALGGSVDPLTHLNLDFPDHELGECVVATHLEVGAKVVARPEGGFLIARPRPADIVRLGRVD